MSEESGINGESAMQPPPETQQVHPVQQAMFTVLGSFAEVARINGQYANYINAVLQVSAIMLSEIREDLVDEVIGRMAAQAEVFRKQAAAQRAANESMQAQEEVQDEVHQAVQQPTGEVSNVH